MRTSTFLAADTLKLRVSIIPTGYLELDSLTYYEVERAMDEYASNGTQYIALKGALQGNGPSVDKPFIVSSAFPNPVSQGSTVSAQIQAWFELVDVKWSVYDIAGRILSRGTLSNTGARIAPLSLVSPLSSGTYSVVVTCRGFADSFSFVVE